MNEYDLNQVRDDADRLYNRARFLVYVHALTGLLLGLFLAMSLMSLVGHQVDSSFPVSGFAAITCAIGGIHGHVKAGELRAEAQRLLCQLAGH